MITGNTLLTLQFVNPTHLSFLKVTELAKIASNDIQTQLMVIKYLTDVALQAESMLENLLDIPCWELSCELKK